MEVRKIKDKRNRKKFPSSTQIKKRILHGSIFFFFFFVVEDISFAESAERNQTPRRLRGAFLVL